MKKIIVFLMAVCLMIPAIDAAQPNKAMQKAMQKEHKAKMKELKKDGWKIFGTAHTLEVALMQHYDKLYSLGENGSQEFGVATNVKSKNIGKQMAANSAAVNYAQKAGSTLQGRIVSDLSANGTDGTEEFEHFYAAYERLVEKEIRNEMEESFSLIRDMPNGAFEIQTFYIVNENAASKARIRALQNAMKESAAAQQHANKISEFVRQGLE